MSPNEIASYLIQQADHPDFAHILEEMRPHLTIEVFQAIRHQVTSETYRNPILALNLVETVVQAVAKIIDTTEAQAFYVWTKGNALLQTNLYKEAIECYQRAEQYFAQQGEKLKVAGLKINQIFALRNLGEYQAVFPLYKEARTLCAELGEVADLYLARLESGVGWVFEELGNPEAALAAYERGYAIHIKLGNTRGVALVNVNRAHALQAMDRFMEAAELLQNSWQVFTQTGLTLEASRANMNMGRLAHQQGQYQQALYYLESAFRGFVALPVETANVNLHRALVYRDLHLNQEMMELAKEAESVLKKNKMRREFIQCLMIQGIGYQRFQLFELAEKFLARARRGLYRQGAQGKLYLVDIERAELALMRGEIEKAKKLASRWRTQVIPERYPSLSTRSHLVLAWCALNSIPLNWQTAQAHAYQALRIAQQYHLAEIQIRAHHVTGQIYEKTSQFEEAWEQYQLAIQTSERLQTYLSFDELQMGFMEDKLAVYEDSVRLVYFLVEQGAMSPAQLLQTLNLVQTAPLVRFHLPSPNTGENSEIQLQLAELRRSWHWYQNRLETPPTKEDTHQPVAAIAGWQQKMQEIERDLTHLLRREQVYQTGVPAQTTNSMQQLPAEEFLAQLQAQLEKHQALLYYFVVNGRFHAIVIQQNHFQLIPDLLPTNNLARLLNAWKFHLHQFSTQSQQSAATTSITQAHLSRLYQMLIRPMENHLAGCTALYLLTPPGWHELPISAFFDGQRYLIEKFSITYLSALDTLSNQSQAPVGTTPGQKKEQAVVVGCSDNGRLPQALQETRLVAQTLSYNWQVTELLEEQATLENFRAACRGCHLIHLATHATFRPDHPGFSWIRLADERLTVTDLYQMKFQNRPLVVLSACETGKGQPRGGGLLGMGRALLVAGAANLVVTLWCVSDQESAQLMSHFYQSLKKTPDQPGIALHQAQKQAIVDQLPPFYWAGFIFVRG